MWKPEHRAASDRRGLRYESDLTDTEWALVLPLIRPAKRGGRPRTVNVREVLNAIFYVLWTGCQWKALPKDLPPRSTVWEYLDLWDWDGTLERIHHALYVEVRENAGREASPTPAIIDSQTAKGAVKGGLRSTRPAMTLARRCLSASATFCRIQLACCWPFTSTPPAYRTATAPRLCSARPDGASRSSSASSATPAIKGKRCKPPSPAPAVGSFRSCAAATGTGSSCCRKDGSWSAPWPGSAAVVGWHATMSVTLVKAAAFVRLAMIRLMLRRLA